MRLLFLSLILSFSALAQHSEQPLKESDSDLRSGVVMFSLEEVDEDKIYWLERTAGEDYFLRKKDGKDETLRKISSRDARAMDMDFASRFLKIQYEIPSKEGKCEVTLRLIMKGDSQDLCKKDDKKAQEIKPFLDGVIKRF